MKLSFVIPAYNEEKCIGSCLSAVIESLKKTGKEAEIIVVNNASTDKTAEVAGGFPGVKVIHEPKKGLLHARQAGYAAATGDILANIDADTMIDSDWLNRVFHEFSKNDKLVALSGPFIYHDLPKHKRPLVKIFYYAGYITHLFNAKVLKTAAMMQGGNFIVKKNSLDQIGGFNLNIEFYGEDTDLAMRLRKIGEVKFSFDLPIKTSARRLLEEGMTAAGLRYIANYFSIIFLKKPVTKKHKDIRIQ